MKVLIVTSFDSTNYALAKVAGELCARGHNVMVATLPDEAGSNVRMFDATRYRMVSTAEVTADFMDVVDVVVGSAIKPKASDALYDLAYERGVLVASFANLFSSVTMRVKADIVFALGESTVSYFRSRGLRYNFAVTGCPQYDRLAAARRSALPHTIRKVIVIDQGGYPYGMKGKRQLADTLLRLARLNHRIEFHVRPRYSPGQGRGLLHAMPEHLFDYLDDRPANLVLLDGETAFEDILPDYDAMIAMWSTAYVAALALNMPLILMSGFDSVDVFDVREQRVDEAYNHLRESGCVVAHDELGARIESSFRLADPAFAAREVANLGSPCAGQVAGIIEQYVNEGIRPSPPWSPDGALVSAGSRTHAAHEAYFRVVNDEFQEFIYLNRCMGEVLDLSPLEAYYDDELVAFACADCATWLAKIKRCMREDFLAIMSAFFKSSTGKSLVNRDRILQDFYFDWLYECGDFDGVVHPKTERVLCPEGREYNIARTQLDGRKYIAAYSTLFSFLKHAAAEPVQQLLKCKRIQETLGPFKSGPKRLLYAHWLLKPENRALIDYVHKHPERNPLLAIAKARMLLDEGRFEECASFCEAAQRELVAGRTDSGPLASMALRVAEACIEGAGRGAEGRFLAKLSMNGQLY